MLEYYWQAFGPLDTVIWVFGGILFLLHFGSLVLVPVPILVEAPPY
jgi:hypothetical protein